MLRFLGLLMALAIAWVAGKDALFDRLDRPDADAALPAPLNYDAVASWTTRPATQPPGAWDTPWGVDVFLILPAPRIGSNTPTLDPSAQSTVAALSDPVFDGFIEGAQRIGPVYAPGYRMVAPSAYRLSEDGSEAARAAAEADILAAFESYLREDNRGRAVLFVSIGETVPLLNALAEYVVSDQVDTTDGSIDLVERTVGYASVRAPDYSPITAPPPAKCMDGVARPCVSNGFYDPDLPLSRFVFPQLPVRALPSADTPYPEGFIDQLKARASAASTWLDQNAPKPAEPLPPPETVEIAPVRRPNEIPPDSED